ncbi:MAG: SEC-C metal-binding domain-containing protein [Syntrophomonas sp.]|uniref:SEC-C metal-binding domain-containing protein n=1 Tax=Syntrophomonas sp. TaxID=2053627 RepID=UPI00261CBD35|nr:SEC-C metal-binding domain-containing protein [Syntrophomonas sp.]MDD2510766.1 SEC-C metal-binding domain-containing protein [Syntrophomonas sp.]MDD3880200.1 SEC-C metal-binding domain-containing protein [Syntrophomonas sp.]MDD4625770.1 SEC-C metal-binding domain-containing protein [Syntrophomonas sp.]
MKVAKPGRNDPCLCGSGKKYKKCCGALSELLDFDGDPFTRYSQLIIAAKIKLDQFYGQQIKKVNKEIKEHFLAFTVDKNLPPEHESLMSDCLWFDLASHDDDTFAFQYLKEHGSFMENPLRDCLTALVFSYLSVYEVKGYQDMHLEIEDIFLAKEHKVLLKEPWEVDAEENPVLLLGRLVNFPGENVFSGMVLVMENKSAEKDFLKQHMEYLSSLLGEKITNLLKFNAEMLYGLFDHAYKKVLLSFNHIESSSINDEERNLLLKQLANNKDYTLLHQTGGYSWFHFSGENRAYARIGVGMDNILFAADLLEDIHKLKQVLVDILPEKEWAVVNNRFRKQPPAEELMSLWFTVIKDRETERWLSTPHGELDKKTPQELLAEENGRERLYDLLDDFSKSLPGKSEQELIQYMKERISQKTSL